MTWPRRYATAAVVVAGAALPAVGALPFSAFAQDVGNGWDSSRLWGLALLLGAVAGAAALCGSRGRRTGLACAGLGTVLLLTPGQPPLYAYDVPTDRRAGWHVALALLLGQVAALLRDPGSRPVRHRWARPLTVVLGVAAVASALGPWSGGQVDVVGGTRAATVPGWRVGTFAVAVALAGLATALAVRRPRAALLPAAGALLLAVLSPQLGTTVSEPGDGKQATVGFSSASAVEPLDPWGRWLGVAALSGQALAASALRRRPA